MNDNLYSNNVILRRNNLEIGIKGKLNNFPLKVSTNENKILIHFQDIFITGVVVEEEYYKIYNVSSEWAMKTTYHCEKDSDEKWFYATDTMDECTSEIERLVIFEARNRNRKQEVNKIQSELRKNLKLDLFEMSFKKFINQANDNVKSGKSKGAKTPYYFEKNNEFDNAYFSQKFGQGNASKTPYMNWWVVSIYYITDIKKIIMGIEEDRYLHIKEMKPLRYEQIGNKKLNVAVFYEAYINNVNYEKLHEKFLEVAEEVMMLGME